MKLTLLLLLISQVCFANMASPIWEGTLGSSAFSSRDIDILNEKIDLKVDSGFRSAFFRIEYVIRTDRSGTQIPLLFHAIDYKGEFKVWVDDQEVSLLPFPDEYKTTADSPFHNFSHSFEPPFREGERETVEIYWGKDKGVVYYLSELKYFETDLSQGEHRIRVEYTAGVWMDRSGWVKEYSFRYSLSPARHWKSFGTLQVTTDASDFNQELTTNLGPPTEGSLDSISTWNFSQIPSDFFEITYKPEISNLAKTLIAIGPFRLTLTFALLAAAFHLISIATFRKRHPAKKKSWVVIAGSIALPLLVIISYIMSFELIDTTIGEEAGRFHGYTIMAILLYPPVMPVYWAIMWLADRLIQRRINNAL